jgi:hypothetical protein
MSLGFVHLTISSFRGVPGQQAGGAMRVDEVPEEIVVNLRRSNSPLAGESRSRRLAEEDECVLWS